MEYGPNWQTSGQRLTNSTHVYTVALWNGTDTFTSFAFCTSQTTIMSLKWWTKILTGYGRSEIWNSTKTFSKFYSHSEHLAVDQVTVLFTGRVIFRQYIPKEHKCVGIKIYKTYDDAGYSVRYEFILSLMWGEEISYRDIASSSWMT
jgi:hypothetical protein